MNLNKLAQDLLNIADQYPEHRATLETVSRYIDNAFEHLDAPDLKPYPFCGSKVNQYKTSVFLCTKCPALINFPICSTYNHAKRLFNERWYKDD